MSRSLPTAAGSRCSKVRGVGRDPGDVHARPCGRRRCGRRRAGRGSAVRLQSSSRKWAVSVRLGELLGGDDVEAHLQLQRGQDRGQVGVAAALAVAVDACPGPGGRPLRTAASELATRALGVVVGVDADLDLARPAASTTAAVAVGDLVGQAAAVGVAEGDVLGAGLDRRAQAFERVAGVVAVAVEEVLGVVDDALALRARRRRPSRRSSPGSPPRETLVTFSRCSAPGLADQADDRGEGLDQGRAAPGRPSAAMPRRRVMPKAQIVALLQLELGELLEELRPPSGWSWGSRPR